LEHGLDKSSSSYYKNYIVGNVPNNYNIINILSHVVSWIVLMLA